VRLSLLFSSRDVRREALKIAVQHRDVMRGKGGTIKAITERVSPRVEDRLASLKSEYELAAKAPSNLRYGYVRAA
jgi:hypothetical protein